MQDLFQLFACISAGIATFSVFMIFSDMFSSIRVEKYENEQTDEVKKTIPLLFRLFLPLAPTAYPLVRSNLYRTQLEQAEEQLRMAGYDQTLSAERYLGLRVILALFGILFAILIFLAKQPAGGLLAILLFIVYPATWLKGIIRKRHLSILKALPNLLDLLTLSVEAGKDFLTALREINTRRKPDALTEELTRTLHEIQLGKNRQTALRNLADRVRQGDLSSVVNAIVQADELGVSIGQLLRIQGEQLRSKRFSRAEKLANETPVKILFPVVVFIFPSVFLILMGPLIMQAMDSIFGG